MKKVLSLYKPVGLTPLQLIKALKEKYPQYENKKLAYAGRLDPMAHGVLLLLVEPETKRRKKYQNLDKEYEFRVLFGMETDTYDVLGIPQKVAVKDISKIDKITGALVGKQIQEYPPYSSKVVKGKPLFWWARKGKLNEIDIPKKKVAVHSIELEEVKTIEAQKLEKEIVSMIEKVEGDFRQKEIVKGWRGFFKKSPEKLPVAELQIRCSSGTYVRSIAHEIGKKLKTGAIALEILRTAVGDFKLENAERLNHL